MAQPVEAFATKPDDLRVNPRNHTLREEPIHLSCPLNSSCVCFRERERDLGIVAHNYEDGKLEAANLEYMRSCL